MRGIGKRTLCLFVFMLSFLLLPVAASELLWTWENCADPSYTGYRYQIDSRDPDGWTEVPSDVTEVRTSESSGKMMYIQSTSDGYIWFDLAQAHYVPDANFSSSFGIRLKINPYMIGIFDFYNGHEIKDAKYLTFTDYGTTAETEIYWCLLKHLALNLDASYSVGIKSETVVPGALYLHMLRLGGGLDVVVPLSHVSLFMGISGGELISINGSSWNPGSYMGARILLDIPVNENFSFGMETSASLSYQNGSEPLLRSLTWILDPLSLSFTYRF